MEIKKFIEIFYNEETEYIFVKTEKEKYEFCFTQEPGSMRSYASAKRNGVKIAETWNEVIQLYHSFGCSTVEAEMAFSYEAHLDDEDEGEAAREAFDAAIAAARNWLYPEEAAAEAAAKEAAEKAREEREAKKAAEAAKKAAEEEARFDTYGDEQDAAVLQTLYKALQQSKKPKAIINYAARFCPRFKSGRFEQPRTIIRAGGREYAFQFGMGWERIY